MHKTDRFYNRGWGVFIHLLDGTINNPARPYSNMGAGRTGWDECINGYDVWKTVDPLAEAGAGYLVLTVMQRSKFMLSPNRTFNEITGYKTGEACSTRDMIAEFSTALTEKGMELLLYFTGDGPLNDPVAGERFGYVSQEDKVSVEFVKKWASVAEEYGRRYGDKILGWWVDGCYRYLGYNEEKLGILANALRAGNPGTLVSLNQGVSDTVSSYSEWDDFTTGESNKFLDIPSGRFINGSQWHILSFLGRPVRDENDGWCQPGTDYTPAYMNEYISKVHENGGIVTVDVYIRRGGSIDPSHLEVLRNKMNVRRPSV
jgi:hypothetical protein